MLVIQERSPLSGFFYPLVRPEVSHQSCTDYCTLLYEWVFYILPIYYPSPPSGSLPACRKGTSSPPHVKRSSRRNIRAYVTPIRVSATIDPAVVSIRQHNAQTITGNHFERIIHIQYEEIDLVAQPTRKDDRIRPACGTSVVFCALLGPPSCHVQCQDGVADNLRGTKK